MVAKIQYAEFLDATGGHRKLKLVCSYRMGLLAVEHPDQMIEHTRIRKNQVKCTNLSPVATISVALDGCTGTTDEFWC